MDDSRTTSPISIRLTFQERATLEKEAGDQPLSTYMRSILLDPDKRTGSRAKRRSRVEDGRALARALALLGQTRLANNLNQLAKAANIGALPVSPETELALVQATAEIRLMRQELMQALGYEAGPS
jgi:hypothetical protein